MKKMNKLFLLLLIAGLISCKSENDAMKVLTTVEEARAYVAEHFDEPEETLLIADELLDPVGVNIALIVDGILKKGYFPKGAEQMDGYRIYKFAKEL